MPVTIKDIAREADVSHSTVSRALNGSPLIPEETAERIRRTAVKLGYLPSAAARTLRTNRSNALGVIIRNVDDPFFGEILQGIEEVAGTSGYSLFMAAWQNDPDRQKVIVQAMVERRVEGVILCSTAASAEQTRRFTSFGVPIVVVNNQSAEEYRYSIYHDDVDGSRQLTRHLVELGHKKIAFLGSASAGRSTQDRQSGFVQELQAAGIPLPAAYIHQVSSGVPADGLQAAHYFLSLKEIPTALVCTNDMLAIGILQGLQKAGVCVPGGMSLTGFDNILFSGFTNPPLTTFDQPKHFIGARAAHLLLELLHAPGEETVNGKPQVERLKGRLLVRGTTASPAQE